MGRRGSIKPHVAFNIITANRKANAQASGEFAVYRVNKNGMITKDGAGRRTPMGTFKTKAEAEKRKAEWERLNPKVKYIIWPTNSMPDEPIKESRLLKKLEMYCNESKIPIPVLSHDQLDRFEHVLNSAGISGRVNMISYEPADPKRYPEVAKLFVSIIGEDFYKNDKIVQRLVKTHFPNWKFAQSHYKSMRPDQPAVWEFWYYGG